MKTHLQLLFLLLLINLSTKAQIYYHDIVPDAILTTWNAENIQLDSTNPATLTVWNEFGNQIDINTIANCEVLMNSNLPLALIQNQNIASVASGSWVQPNYAILNNGLTGYWIGVSDKYLGVRIKKNNHWYYGWIRMDVNTAGTSVTIKDYAYNTLPDASINAGQTVTGIWDIENNYLCNVYPNPFNSTASITIPIKLMNASLEIYNSVGENVKTILNIESDKIVIERNFLPAGLYFLNISGNSIIVSKEKLIIID